MQQELEKFRSLPEYPVYPPYHKGLYLEDYFCDWFYRNDIQTERKYIPVSWTTCYVDKKTNGLQEALNKLNVEDKYFTVSQYDDGDLEKLPPNTLHFSAGGNAGGIPIPLICSPLPHMPSTESKDMLCSFVGSATHPIRIRMYETLAQKKDCIVQLKNWSPTVEKNDFQHFINIANRSKFLLCPRGYGLNSFRLYEAFQLGCVPVVITDKFFLPWEEELDWSEFSVLICEEALNDVYDIISSIPNDYYHRMLQNAKKLYADYFSLPGMCKQIRKNL